MNDKPTQSKDLTALTDLSQEQEAGSEPAIDFSQGMPPMDDSLATPSPEAPPVDRPTPPSDGPPSAMDAVRDFSEHVTIGEPALSASYPFTLMIEGELGTLEREKLLEFLGRENMGIREMDLEPQFESGRVLIPRISEYAAILIVQLLRSCDGIRMRMLPSDSSADWASIDQPGDRITTWSAEPAHPAESIAVSALSALPDARPFSVIDALSASARLKSAAIEAEESTEYLECVENLKRELKYKAWRKGATAILNFSVSLTPLSDPTRYRLTAVGSAIRTTDSASSDADLKN